MWIRLLESHESILHVTLEATILYSAAHLTVTLNSLEKGNLSYYCKYTSLDDADSLLPIITSELPF